MPGVVTAVAISREAKRPVSTGKPAVGFMARGPGSASTSANCLPRRSPIVEEALRDPVPPGNHRNLATLGLYFGHQSRLLLRCPLPASSTRATISPSNPRTPSVRPEGFRLLSARPPRPHASDRVRPDAYPGSTRSSASSPISPIRRGVHRSTAELEAAISAYIETVGADPKPFVWTKSAADILASIECFCLAGATTALSYRCVRFAAGSGLWGRCWRFSG
jgi:hypothetical protein